LYKPIFLSFWYKLVKLHWNIIFGISTLLMVPLIHLPKNNTLITTVSKRDFINKNSIINMTLPFKKKTLLCYKIKYTGN